MRREDKKDRQMEVDWETEEDMGKKRKREEKNEGNETVIVLRRWVNRVSTEAFEIFSLEEHSERCGNSFVTFGRNRVVCQTVIL